MAAKTDRTLTKAYFAWISVCIIWGTTFLAIRIGVGVLPPFLFAGFRWLLAGGIIFTVLKWRGIEVPDKKNLLKLAVPGLCLLGVANGLVVVAEQWIPSGLVALLVATYPFWMFVSESRINRALRFNKRIVYGLVFGFAGLVFIFAGDTSFPIKGSFIWGLLLLLISVSFWCFGSLYAKYTRIKGNLIMGVAIQMLIAGTAQTTVGLLMGELKHFQFDQSSLLAFLYLVFVASILGYGSYMYAIQHLPVSLVSTHAYINPVIALFLGWVVLNEPMNLKIILATLIILAGVFMIKSGMNKTLISVKDGAQEK